MKVTGVKTTIYQSELTRKKGDANSPGGRVNAGGMVVEITTDEAAPARRGHDHCTTFLGTPSINTP